MLGADGEISIYAPRLKPPRLEATEGQEPRLLFLAVKSYDVRTALETWAPHLRPKQDVLVILSNGYYLDQIRDVIGTHGDQVRLGSSFVGCKLLKEGRYLSQNWRDGSVVWGPSTPASLPGGWALEETLFFADVNSKWQENIIVTMAKKWVMNTTLNSVCAVYQLSTNGQALEKKAVHLREVFSEAWLHAQQIWLPESQNPDGFVEEEELWKVFLRVIAQTRDNANSMYVDFQQGRKTEWAYLAGKCLAAPGSVMAVLQEKAAVMGIQ
jgi:ketopantoate reductase